MAIKLNQLMHAELWLASGKQLELDTQASTTQRIVCMRDMSDGPCLRCHHHCDEVRMRMLPGDRGWTLSLHHSLSNDSGRSSSELLVATEL